MTKLEKIRAEFGSPMNVFSSLIRAMFIASPGCEFFCGDFSGVELRLLFWVAEHEEGLQRIREGVDLYRDMAAYLFSLPINTITKESRERFIAKESVLACGYGMGFSKFLITCHSKGAKDVDEELAKKAVYAYRKKHHPVPTLWKNVETAVIEAIRYPGTAYTLNKVTIYVKDNFLNIKLPSGRRLKYFKPRLAQKMLGGGRVVSEIRHWGMDPKTHQWVEMATWGGVLVNNIIQGISRDLMANAMVKIEEGGYQFLLSIHDEGLSERKKGEGSQKSYLSLMADNLPKWAEGAPIAAEGWVGDRYRK